MLLCCSGLVRFRRGVFVYRSDVETLSNQGGLVHARPPHTERYILGCNILPPFFLFSSLNFLHALVTLANHAGRSSHQNSMKPKHHNNFLSKSQCITLLIKRGLSIRAGTMTKNRKDLTPRHISKFSAVSRATKPAPSANIRVVIRIRPPNSKETGDNYR